MQRLEVIVIGGGITGATTAAMVAELGLKVALIDSATCASRGGSAYSGGIVRLFDRDPVMMALGQHALNIRQQNRVGRVFDRAIRRTGVLYRTHVSDEPVLHAELAAQGPLYRAELLGAQALARITDFVRPCPDRIDLYEPQGGFSDVRFAVQSMVHLVRQAGMVIEHAPVRRLVQSDNGLAEVYLASGAILSARVVVVATGPWISSLLPWVPVESRSVPLGLIETPAAPHLPVIDMVAGSYCVPFGAQLVGVGCGPRHVAASPEALPSAGPHQVADSLEKLAAMAGRDLPTRSIAVLNGLDAYTSDARPILGFQDDTSPFYAVSGMSGLGFKIAPAIADMASNEIHARLRDVAIFPQPMAEQFRAARFGAVPVQPVKQKRMKP